MICFIIFCFCFCFYKNKQIKQFSSSQSPVQPLLAPHDTDNVSYSSGGRDSGRDRDKSPAAYMLGTASSSKRDLETAKTGKETGEWSFSWVV